MGERVRSGGEPPRGPACARDSCRCGGTERRRGFSQAEMLIALAVMAVLFAAVATRVSILEGAALGRSAWLARAHLTRARTLAVAGRQTLQVRVSREGSLLLLDRHGTRLAITDLTSEGPWRLDSLRLRPATLRYNARGQASAGSLYLYRGRRALRLVSNFVGRIRLERLTD